MIRNKIIVKKIRNIFILLMTMMIIFGVYHNIRNSKAENVIQIELEVSDKNNIISTQTVTLDATETNDGNYLMNLPIAVNKNIVSKYYTASGEEIAVDTESNIATMQLTDEEISNKKVQIQIDYDTKEVNVNNEMKLLYKKELTNEPFIDNNQNESNANGTDTIDDTTINQDVTVTGYMPEDAKLEVKELDLKELTSVKVTNENQSLQKAYEISIYQIVEKKSNENEIDNTNTEEASEETTNGSDNKTEESLEENIETERVEYDPSVYGEKVTVKTNYNVSNAIATIYGLEENNQITKIESTTTENQENIIFETEKADETIKYIIAIENEQEEQDETNNQDNATTPDSNNQTTENSNDNTNEETTGEQNEIKNSEWKVVESIPNIPEGTAIVKVKGPQDILTEDYVNVIINGEIVDQGITKKIDKKEKISDGFQYTIQFTELPTEINQMKIELINPYASKVQTLALNEENSEDTSDDSDIMLLATTYNTLKSTKSEVPFDDNTTDEEAELAKAAKSGFLGNTSVQRGNIGKVTFSNSYSAWGRGLIRNFSAVNNTGNGHSNSAKTWKDLSGKNNGTLTGGTWYSDHLQLDGIDDWVNLGYMSFTNAVTLDATIQIDEEIPDEGDQKARHIMVNFESGGLGLHLYGRTPVFTIHRGSNAEDYVHIRATTKVKTGEKIRITGTYDGKKMRIYINGKLEAEQAQTGNIDMPLNDTVMAMGVNPSGSGVQDGLKDFLNMKVYSAKIHNVALTADEVAKSTSTNGYLWDVSANNDKSIIASTSSFNAPYTVNIESSSTIYANANADYLFALIGYGDKCKDSQVIENIGNLDVSNSTSMLRMFFNTGVNSMTSLKLGDKFDTSNVTSMASMFSGTGKRNMTSLEFGKKFNTSKVTDMKYMFHDCGYDKMTSLNLENFNTSNVKYMQYMFLGCGYTSMTDLKLGSNFNTSKVIKMNYMFKNCGYTAMISLNLGDKFDTSNVTDMSNMFKGTGYTAMTSLKLGDKFDTSSVTSMDYMFSDCGYTAMTSLNLGNKFNTNKVTGMFYMFYQTGKNSMTTLDLGPAFTSIPKGASEGMCLLTGNTKMKIYAPESIYKDRTSFKMSSTDTSTQSGSISVNGGRSIDPKYKPEWTVTGTTVDTTNKALKINLKGATNTSNYTSNVTTALNPSDVSIWIDGIELGKVNKSVTTSTKTGTNVTHTITISNFEEAIRQAGKNYKEWSGNIAIKIGGRGENTSTYSKNILVDAYGNQSMSQIDDSTGTWVDVQFKDSTPSSKNESGKLFADFVGPTIMYASEETTINHGNKKVRVSLCITDKYFSTSTLSTDTTASKITVKLDGVEAVNATKSLAKSVDLYGTIDGKASTKYGEMYELEISNLDQGEGGDYSGIMTLVFQEGIVEDQSSNKNITTTITVGISEPSTSVKPSDLYDSTGTNSEALHIGDFVNYDAGTWTQSEIDSIKTGLKTNLKTATGTVPTGDFQFGGMVSGSSRNGNGVEGEGNFDRVKDASTNERISGWRVFDINGDSVTLISAGNPESYYQPTNSDSSNAFIGEYILSGNVNSSWSNGSKEKSKYQIRDWSMYVNKEQKATNAIAITQKSVKDWYRKYTDAEVDNMDINDNSVSQRVYNAPYYRFQNIIDNGSWYWIAGSKYNEIYNFWPANPGIGHDSSATLGIRVLVTLSSDVLFSSEKTGTRTLTGGNMNTYGGNQEYNCWDIVEKEVGTIVDVVNPVWKAKNIKMDEANQNVTLDLIATDKYLTGIENSTLKTDDITITVDGDENNVIVKSLSLPTFSTNEETGMKEIKYTLTLSNWEEAEKQSGKSFYEYSGSTKITIAEGTIHDDTKQTIKASDENGIEVGDFVNYDAGTWTQSEINSIKTGLKTNLQTANGTESMPTNNYQFGGFKVGSSRNRNAAKWSNEYVKDAYTYNDIEGWRVFDIDGDAVTLISAGNPEDYYHSYKAEGTNASNGIISEYILTGNVNSGWSNGSTEKSKYQIRNWSMYVNEAQKAISAMPLTGEKLANWYNKYTELSNVTTSDIYEKNDLFQKIYEEPYRKYQNIIDNYAYYWVGNAQISSGGLWNFYRNNRSVGSDGNIAYGIRMLVTLSSDVVFSAQKKETKTLYGGNMSEYGYCPTYNCWNIATGTEGKSDGKSNLSKQQTLDLGILDVVKPKIEKEKDSTTVDIISNTKTATIKFNVTDKFLKSSNTLSASNIKVYVDGNQTSSVTKTLSRVTAKDVSTTVNGASRVVSQQYSLTLSGFSSVNQQIKIQIPSGTILDEYGNANKSTDFIVYNVLKSTKQETEDTSGFLGNSEIARQDVEKVVFTNNNILEPIKRGLIRSYSAYNNTGNGHASSTTSWTDLTGTGNSTINGGTWGKDYLQFDGVDDWVNLGQIDLTNNVSLDATVSIDSIQEKHLFIINNFENGGCGLQIWNGKPRFTLYLKGIGYVDVESSESLTSNKKTRLTCTYDGTKAILYVDGKKVAEKIQNGDIEISRNNTVMAMGANPSGNDLQQGEPLTKMKLYSANIYNIALTETEVASSQLDGTSWDVSAQQDDSINAWTSNKTAPYTVYIGSSNEIFANKDSSYLCANIGGSEKGIATDTINNIELLNVTNVTDMSHMFECTGYEAMTSLDLGDKFDTSSVTNMSNMFQGTGYMAMTSFNLGDKFDTSNVTDMSNMFQWTGYYAMTSLDLGDKFDTSSVKNMSAMFSYTGYGAMTSLNLREKFDTSNVTNMAYMFYRTGSRAMTTLTLGDKFNTEKVTNMSYMFSETGLKVMTALDLGNQFYTTAATDMSNMFNACGQTAMTALDLGPVFTKIADTNTNMFTNTGKSGTVIYVPESIYKNKTSFKKSSTDTTTTAGAIAVSTGRTVSPIYKPEWTVTGTAVNTTNKKITIDLKGATNSDNYISNVTTALEASDISVWIDGTELTKVTTTVTDANPETGESVTHTITISDFEETLRQVGKSYKEWSGNISLKIDGRGKSTSTYSKNVLVDEYGNQSMSATDETGTWIDVSFKNAEASSANESGKLFADFINPEFTYEYANTTIDHENKKVTVVFDIVDKYFSTSKLSTDTTANNIEVTVDGKTVKNDTVKRKTLSKTSDIEETINGKSGVKIGERYTLTLTNLDEGEGGDYSGIVKLAFSEGAITDKSGNTSVSKTITIGIDDPTTDDEHTNGEIVDVVSPVWKTENINIDKSKQKVTVDLIATDKYGVESSTLTINDITLKIDGEINANTAITKEFENSSPISYTNTSTGVKEIKYTLILSGWKEASEELQKQTGKSYSEYSGTTEITIAKDTVTDKYTNKSQEQTLSLGHVDFIKPRIEKVSSTRNETAKTETIIFNVIDKYIYINDTISTSEITVYVDGENASTIIKTLTRITGNDVKETVNGTSQVVSQQYQLVLSNFEKSERNTKNVKDWSGTVSIDVAESAVKDQESGGSVNTNEKTTIKADFVDFVQPDLTYVHQSSDIDKTGKSYTMTFTVTDKYYSSGTLGIDDLTIKMQNGQKDSSGNEIIYNLKDEPVTISLQAENLYASNIPITTNVSNGTIETKSSVQIGHTYTLTISNLEQLEAKAGITTADYSGIVTVAVAENKVLDKGPAGNNTNQNGNIVSTITSGVNIPGGTTPDDAKVVDVVDPVWKKIRSSTDVRDSIDNTSSSVATVTFKGTDAYYASNSLTADKIKIFVNGTEVDSSSVTKTLSTATALTEQRKEFGKTTTITKQYGVEYTLTIKGFIKSADQVKIQIPADTLKDETGNSNKVTEMVLYNVLKSTQYENLNTSPFLGNSSIQRKNIENVTFETSIPNTVYDDFTKEYIDSTAWDVSERGDKSIIAWYEKSNSKGALKVHIGSNDEIFANQNSGFLFANIGLNSICTETETITNLDLLNTGSVFNMANMFMNCGYVSMTELTLPSTFNTSKVENMNSMFSGCGFLNMTTLELGSNFDTSNVVDMGSMFNRCGYSKMTKLDLASGTNTTNTTQFNTSKVENMSMMFNKCGFKEMESLNLGTNFNTENVTNMKYMFANTGNEKMTSLNLENKFNTSNVTNMDKMFFKCGYTLMTTLNLGQQFNTSKVTTMNSMFYGCGYTEMTSLDLGDLFYTSKVTDMYKMFYNCGKTKMKVLDLGAVFTTIPNGKITKQASDYEDWEEEKVTNYNAYDSFMEGCGTTGLIIYAPESIYSNQTAFYVK